MKKFTMNDIYILKVFEKKGIRHKNPIHFLDLLDSLRDEYGMSRKEVFNSLTYLKEINYIEENGSVLSLTEYSDEKIYAKRGETMIEQYTLEQKKAARFKMLEKFYQESGGSENSFHSVFDIGEALHFSKDLTLVTSEYLSGEWLIEYKAMGGLSAITHHGIVQYEHAIEAPETASKYFPPVKIIQNILHVEKMNNTQIQQGTTDSKQEMTKNGKYDDLMLWLQNFEEALKREKKEEILEELRDDIDFIKTSITTEKPNIKYLKIALNTIQGVLTGIASNAIFQELQKGLQILIA